MSSHDVKSITQGAILIANDLRTGFTAYLREDGSWSTSQHDAWIITTDAESEHAKTLGTSAANDNEIVDPYLVATTPEGDPTHIRERLRTTGPSVDYLTTSL